MKKLYALIFSTLMLCVIVGNSILEIGLSAKIARTEIEKSELEENDDTNESGKEEGSEKESTEKESSEKEEKQTDDLIAYATKNFIILALNAFTEKKAGLAHFYADNLHHVSCDLESPPPEAQ